MVDRKRPLAEGIAKLFNSPDFADANIYIGDFEMPAHSVVLATQSPFFQKALSENFREGKSKKFLFKEGSAHAHWRVFEYMYTGSYAEEPTKLLKIQDDDELVKDVRVYATADFFMLDDLKQLALERFTAKVAGLWVSELFTDCIQEVYDSTVTSDDRLRKVVIEAAKTRRASLWKRQTFRDLIHGGGDFAVDLMAQFCQ